MSFLGGLFHPGRPYEDASKVYNQYYQQGMGELQPYNQMGQQGMQNYSNALSGMANPTAYINNIMSQYSMSPGAQFEMQQGTQAAQNAASASGMLGSGAYGKGMEEFATGLTSQDMQQYLQNALGVQGQYLGGESNLGQMGLNAGSQMNAAAQQAAQQQSALKYGQEQAPLNAFYNLLGAGAGFAGNYMTGGMSGALQGMGNWFGGNNGQGGQGGYQSNSNNWRPW